MASQATAATRSSGPILLPASSSTLSSQARNTFKASFERFEQTVKSHSSSDHREFSSTTLQDVREAAQQVEQQLAARQCMRNMRRLEPLLNGLEAYSKVLEVLCNGTPYVSWVWAPIKLMLKLATDYLSAFEKLIAAYGRIAENLPRFDRLSNAYRNNPDFQQVLAVVYSDILEFHRKAYKFFRKTGWKCFFKSAWGRFDTRFNCILESLSRHADLVDREANAFAIAQTMQWREEALQAAVTRTKERSAIQLSAALAWLEPDRTCGQHRQEDILDQLANDCCPGTAEWILKHQRMKTWLKDGRSSPTLWLKGKPGSGKSTLCAKIIQFLRAEKRSTLLFCFYSYRPSGASYRPSGFIFATLLSQILRQNQTMSAYVYEDFVAEGQSPSMQTLKTIFNNLLPQLKSPRIIVDGIDECIHYDVSGAPQNLSIIRDVVQGILQLDSMASNTSGLKLLLSSRDIPQILRKFSRKPAVALDNETDLMRSAIRAFTRHRLLEIRDRFDSFSDVDSILDSVENKIVFKSQEMFLWARLVLMQIEEDAFSINDLETAIMDMPATLNEFYARILSRMRLLNRASCERVNIILKWMICSRRPLRTNEIQDAIAFSGNCTVLNDKTKLPATVIDLCKPLIQVLNDNTVIFVHFTVQEFLVNSRCITLLEAERCITRCSLNYLEFSLGLIDSTLDDERRTINVGTCLYSLQSYTHEHWLDHLLASISGVGTHAGAEAYLRNRLNRLLACMDRNRVPLEKTSESDELGPILTLEPRLACFKNDKSVFEFLKATVQHRQLKRLHFGEQMLPGYEVPGLGSTRLGAVHDEYQKRVMFLLSSHTVPGLDTTQLSIFKAIHSPYAFTCRFPGCSSTVAGFPTEETRAQHEKTHAPPLLCAQSGCTYPLPFSSLNDLKRHVREYHVTTAARVPRSVRPISKATNLRNMFSTSHQPPRLSMNRKASLEDQYASAATYFTGDNDSLDYGVSAQVNVPSKQQQQQQQQHAAMNHDEYLGRELERHEMEIHEMRDSNLKRRRARYRDRSTRGGQPPPPLQVHSDASRLVTIGGHEHTSNNLEYQHGLIPSIAHNRTNPLGLEYNDGHKDSYTLPQSNSPQDVTDENTPGLVTTSSAIRKTPFPQPQHPKILCPHCKMKPDGFSGLHELEKHIVRNHNRTRKAFVCDTDWISIENCKDCHNKKQYGLWEDAVAHLSGTHDYDHDYDKTWGTLLVREIMVEDQEHSELLADEELNDASVPDIENEWEQYEDLGVPPAARYDSDDSLAVNDGGVSYMEVVFPLYVHDPDKSPLRNGFSHG